MAWVLEPLKPVRKRRTLPRGVTRATAAPKWDVSTSPTTHMFPSLPSAIPSTKKNGTLNRRVRPAVVMRATCPLTPYHKDPSRPAAIGPGSATLRGTRNSLIFPAGVTRPMRSRRSVNQTLPSRPAVIDIGLVPGFSNSVIAPAGVMRPITSKSSVNQRLPSGPAVIAPGDWPIPTLK